MSGTNAELIKEARGGYSGQEWVKDHHPHSAVGLALRLADALEAAGAERDALRAFVASVAPWTVNDYWAKFEGLRTPEMVAALQAVATK